MDINKCFKLSNSKKDNESVISTSEEVNLGIEELNHNVKECIVCKRGWRHGALIEEYSKDRAASSFSIIVNTISIFTVAVCPSIPWVFSQAGWFAIFVILWLGLLAWFGCKYLIKALYSVKGHRFYDYTALATHYFGYWTGFIARLVSHFIQICTTGVLVVSILDNFELFLSYLGYNNIISNNFKLSALLATSSIAIPGYFIRNMNDATLTSAIGSINVISVLLVSIIQCRPDYNSHPPMYNLFRLKKVANSFNFVLFCFCGMLNFPHLERSMKYPHKWNRDMALGILFACLSFIIIGVMGYWAFGKQVKISFYENLPKTWTAIYLTITFIIQAHTSSLTLMLIVVDEERPQLRGKLKSSHLLSQLIYITVHSIPYIIIWLLIIGIKFFESFANLTGSISGVYFSIVLPALYYLMGNYKKMKLKYDLIPINIMLIFGLTMGNYFIYVSVLELIKGIKKAMN